MFTTRKVFLLASLLMPLASNFNVSSAPIPLGISTEIIGPFIEHESDCYIDVVYYMPISDPKVYETVTFGTGVEHYAEVNYFPQHEVARGEKNVLNVRFKTSDYLGKNGMYFKVSIYTPIGLHASAEAIIYPSSRDVVNPIEDEIHNLSYDNLAFQFDRNSTIYYGVDYNFDNLLPYFDTSQDHILGLDTIYFEIYSELDIPYGTSKMLFLDYKNVFPLYNKEEDGYKYILCSVYGDDENRYRSSYYQYFYYDVETFDVSDKYHLLYNVSRTFYFPINREKDIENYTFYLYFEDIGPSLITVIVPVKYEILTNNFGLCNSSKHCVIGGIKK